jgi:hypothetical protein
LFPTASTATSLRGVGAGALRAQRPGPLGAAGLPDGREGEPADTGLTVRGGVAEPDAAGVVPAGVVGRATVAVAWAALVGEG